MHVAFNGWFWDQPHTGSGQYLRHLLVALSEAAPQHRFSLVIPAHIRTLEGVPPQVDVRPVAARFSGNLGKVWFEQRAFPRAAGELGADLAHVPYWGPPLRSPMPLVCSVLDVIPLAVREYGRGLMNRLYTGLVVAGARGASRLLTLSHASRVDVAARVGVPLDRIDVTYLAADARFNPRPDPAQDAAVRARYRLDDVDDFVLYLGSFAVHKNVPLLLAAYTYVAQAEREAVPVVLAGRQPKAWGPRFPDLPAYIAKLGLAPFVRWIGPVAEDDKPALYRQSSVFAFPSRYEGFGLGPLEAMASGTPVVACEVSSIPEVVGDAAFLVPPTGAREMGGAILALLNQPDFARDMRARGLARARQFTWQQTAEATLAAYTRVV